MGIWLHLLWTTFRNLVRSRCRLTTENLLLRHQLNVATRRRKRRIRFTGADRALFVWLYWRSPVALSAAVVLRTFLLWKDQENSWRVSLKLCGAGLLPTDWDCQTTRSRGTANWCYSALGRPWRRALFMLLTGLLLRHVRYWLSGHSLSGQLLTGRRVGYR